MFHRHKTQDWEQPSRQKIRLKVLRKLICQRSKGIYIAFANFEVTLFVDIHISMFQVIIIYFQSISDTVSTINILSVQFSGLVDRVSY